MRLAVAPWDVAVHTHTTWDTGSQSRRRSCGRISQDLPHDGFMVSPSAWPATVSMQLLTSISKLLKPAPGRHAEHARG